MVHNTVNVNTICHLVSNNFGISIIPNSLADRNLKSVQFIELKNIKHTTTLSLVYNKENRNPVISSVIELYKDHI